MPTFYLVRHGHNDFVGKRIAGWLPDVHLNAEGREQAARAAARLVGRGITRLYTSPLERARETAESVAQTLGLEPVVRENLGEVRYGEWTGKTFAELQDEPLWKLYNTYRSGTRAPGGESMLDCQHRIVTELECLAEMHPGESVAVVSHGDIIRSALLFWLGMPIDLFHRIEVRVGSVSVARMEARGVVVAGLGWE
jgi:probable phosphoglycerate mutase